MTIEQYLDAEFEAGNITDENRAFAHYSWEEIRYSKDYRISVPNAAVSPDGEIMFAWNKDEHHLELEIFLDDKAEWFYLNRTTDETIDADYELQGVPETIKDKLALFEEKDKGRLVTYFTKKPITVKAVRWYEDGDHPEVSANWNRSDAVCNDCGNPIKVHGRLHTQETDAGDATVCPGDWITDEDQGRIFLYKPSEFEARYEPPSVVLADMEDWTIKTILKKYPECWETLVVIVSECMNKDGEKRFCIETNDFLENEEQELDLCNHMISEFHESKIVAWFYYDR